MCQLKFSNGHGIDKTGCVPKNKKISGDKGLACEKHVSRIIAFDGSVPKIGEGITLSIYNTLAYSILRLITAYSTINIVL